MTDLVVVAGVLLGVIGARITRGAWMMRSARY